MHVTVWIDDSIPPVDRTALEEISRDTNHVVLFDEGRLFNNVIFFRSDYKTSTTPVDERLFTRTRLLLISTDVPDPWAGAIQGFFGNRTLCQRMPPVHDLLS
jgi:hypothetical protein